MASSIAKKLRIKEGDTLLTLHAPAGFEKNLGDLPAGVKVLTSGKTYQQIHWFVLNKKLLDKNLPAVMTLLQEDTLAWVYYPKGSSKMQTDLTRDKGWEDLLTEDIQWLTLISFDDTWSAFSFRRKTASNQASGRASNLKSAAPAKERPVLEYIDAAKKTVRLPEDLSTRLEKNKKAGSFFESLSFTNKKEYVEWIVSAKRAETRTKRVKETLDRLGKGWKNPRNL